MGHTLFLHHGSFQKPSTGVRLRFVPSGNTTVVHAGSFYADDTLQSIVYGIPDVRDMCNVVHNWVQSKAAVATVLGNLSKVVRIGPDGLASMVPRVSLAE